MNPQHLLDQATRLATETAGRPRQADLRRAVSTAYYALFHLLTQAGAACVSRRNRELVTRCFGHSDMKAISQRFSGTTPPTPLQPFVASVPADLNFVAKAFVALQEARHIADYDIRPVMNFSRQAAVELVNRAREAFDAWERVRNDPTAEVYLLAMLFPKLGQRT
jgi:hypothetical protein